MGVLIWRRNIFAVLTITYSWYVEVSTIVDYEPEIGCCKLDKTYQYTEK